MTRAALKQMAITPSMTAGKLNRKNGECLTFTIRPLAQVTPTSPRFRPVDIAHNPRFAGHKPVPDPWLFHCQLCLDLNKFPG